MSAVPTRSSRRHDGPAAFAASFRLVFAGVAAALTLSVGAGLAEGVPDSPQQAASTNSTSSSDGPAAYDAILLANGEQCRGVLLSDTLTLRTAFGLLKFDNRFIATVDFDAGSGFDRLTTVNGDRLNGLIEDARVAFQSERGDPMEVQRARLARLTLRPRTAPPDLVPDERQVRLRNGDLLTGRLLAETVAITEGATNHAVPWSEVTSATVRHSQSVVVTLALRSGEVLRGMPAPEELPIRLWSGPAIDIPWVRIELLRDSSGSGGVPQTVLRAAAEPEPGALADVMTGATNVDGMIWIPPGQFVMGSPNDELGRDQDEGPETRVTLPRGFWIGRHEVTQAAYKALLGTNPSVFTGDPTRPVEKVSWQEAMDYCGRLTEQVQAAGRLPAGYAYRLPTEAEWEYACRAGTSTRFSHGDDRNYPALEEHGWFVRNSQSSTHPVGSKQPNPWGLSDMHGNVWEWCLDRWNGGLPGGAITNLPLVAEGSLRVARGGSWLYDGRVCRSANRDEYSYSNRCSDVGFRVVLAPVASVPSR